MLRLTRNQLEVSEQSLKVALERGAQCTKTTSMASATTATLKDDSAQELSQAKNVKDAQRLENFSLTQELMSLKAELAEVKAKVATIPVPVQPPPIASQQERPLMKGQHQEPIQSHDTWESWDSPEVSHFSDWYQSKVDQIMEERNKLYAERDQESLKIARTLWHTENLHIPGDLPLYMLKARMLFEVSAFLREHKDHTQLGGYQPVNLDRYHESMKNQPE